MRVLFATTAGAGHFGPLVPLAWACAVAGHEVVVAAPDSFADEVKRTGLAHAGFADVPREIMDAVFARLPEMSLEEANKVVISEVFGRLDAQAALPGLTALIRDHRPDVVVREPCELGSLVAAEAAGVPHTQVSIGMTVSEAHLALMISEPLAELAALGGIAAEQATRALLTAPRFSCVPAVLDEINPEDLRLEGIPAQGPVWRFRADLPLATGDLPGHWGDPDQPLVYVTFGSVTATIGPFSSVYPAVLGALADEPVRVLMTTGSGLEPDDLGPLPANTHVERWWPQHDVLPHTAAVVGHGGFGTTIGALAAGVPQVVLPLFAHDQFVNAAHVAAIGAGIHLPGGAAAAGALPSALADVLATPTYRQAAEDVASRMTEHLPVADCVPMLEDLARS